MKFNPEDANLTDQPADLYNPLIATPPGAMSPAWNKALYQKPGTGDFGPHCRNCHRGSSDCAVCHENFADAWPATDDADIAAMNKENAADYTVWHAKSTFDSMETDLEDYWRHERTVYWEADWRKNPGTTTDSIPSYASPGIDTACSNDGFSWPHRTMGFKLLKDELWGLDFDGSEVWVGETRDGYTSYITTADVDGVVVPTGISDTLAGIPASLRVPAQDMDSACLDCHNPNIWNVTDMGDSNDLFNRKDRLGDTTDDMNDELLLRGLP